MRQIFALLFCTFLINAVFAQRPFPAGLPTCLEDDFRELEKLYDAANGDSWTNKTNWFSNNLATWHGIILTSNGCDVQNITLLNNNLTGTLYDLVLPKLRTLSLSSNNLTGSIPNFNLPELTDLYLSSNQLSGAVPNFNFPKVRNLYLDYNQLSGSLPALNLPELTNFWLFNNQISGNLPNLNTPKLLSMAFSNNQFSGTIPTFNTPLIYYIQLDGNSLSGSIPNFSYPNLTYLQLEKNQLTGTIPNFNLPNLQRLYLYQNQLTGAIPNFDLPKLAHLLLSKNQLSGTIPNFNLPKLNTLWLQENQLTGSIPNLNLPLMEFMYFGDNQLTGSIPNFSMPVLKHLYFQNNEFSGAVPNFSTPQLNNIQAFNNKFVFGDIVNNTFLTATGSSPFAAYAPQKKIPLSILNGFLSVSTGEPNTVQQFEWYKDGILIATTQNNQYQPTTLGTYKCKVTHNTLTISNNVSKNLVLESEDFVYATLPVNLLAFKAKNIEPAKHQVGRSALLTWHTADEKNTSHFDVEQSTDGINFDKIGEVKAKGITAHYEFLDNNFSNKKTYYRLKINDLDGQFTHSKIETVVGKNSNLTLKIYPNPVTEATNLEIVSATNSDINIQLFDIFGKKIWENSVENTPNTEGVIKPISFTLFPKGTYFLRVSNGSETTIQKIVKQ